MGYPIFHSQYTAAQIEASIGKTPRIKSSTRTWEIWDIATSAYVDTGVSIDTQLYVDPTLTESGYAADAKVTGDKIGELKSAIDYENLLTNDLAGLIDYDYNYPCDLAETTGASDGSRIGVKRSNNCVVLNLNGTSFDRAIIIRLSGAVVRATSNSTVRGWNTGITLKNGQKYKAVVKLISGSSTYSGNLFTPSVSVYAVGTSSSIGEVTRNGNISENAFTAGNTDYNLALYVSSGMLLSNATFIITLEEVNNVTNYVTSKQILTVANADAGDLAQGYWAVADGAETSSSSWVRSALSLDADIDSIYTENSNLKLYLLAYSGNTYIGTWLGSAWSTTFDNTYVCRDIDLSDFRSKYPTYTFRLDITAISGQISPSGIASDIKVSRNNVHENDTVIKITYGNIVNSKYWENGTINSSGIKGAGTTLYKRLVTIPFMRFLAPVTVTPKDGYSISVTTYTLDRMFEAQFSAWSTMPFTFSNVDKLYKVVIKKTDDTVIVPTNISDYITAQTLVNTPFDRMLAEYANVKAVNHRGYNFIAPENTLVAYEMSAQRGFKYVETDVLFTSDGVPVLMHDDTINRTCCNASDGSAISGDVSIESVSYEDLITDYDACTSAQWPTWKGIKVPTFAEFMYCCKAHNLHPWIELKWTHTYTLPEVQQIISIIKQYGMEEHVSFISFSYDALALVASEWDTVELGLNGTIANAKLLRTGKNRVFMIYNQSNSYADAIAEGLQVCVYTVNTVAQLSALTNQGFDSILTNGLLPSQVCDVVRCKYQSGV